MKKNYLYNKDHKLLLKILERILNHNQMTLLLLQEKKEKIMDLKILKMPTMEIFQLFKRHQK